MSIHFFLGKKRLTMSNRHKVTCIKKSNRSSPHERITHIGGVGGDGQRWSLTQPAAIDGIEKGTWRFFVSAYPREVDVIVATSRFGNKYLKTTSDGEEPNNLLSLPECP
jgi:hypothetical protein